jgi:hypothetical protein
MIPFTRRLINGRLVAGQVVDAVGDDQVHGVVRQKYRLDVALG